MLKGYSSLSVVVIDDASILVNLFETLSKGDRRHALPLHRLLERLLVKSPR